MLAYGWILSFFPTIITRSKIVESDPTTKEWATVLCQDEGTWKRHRRAKDVIFITCLSM